MTVNTLPLQLKEHDGYTDNQHSPSRKICGNKKKEYLHFFITIYI